LQYVGEPLFERVTFQEAWNRLGVHLVLDWEEGWGVLEVAPLWVFLFWLLGTLAYVYFCLFVLRGLVFWTFLLLVVVLRLVELLLSVVTLGLWNLAGFGFFFSRALHNVARVVCAAMGRAVSHLAPWRVLWLMVWLIVVCPFVVFDTTWDLLTSLVRLVVLPVSLLWEPSGRGKRPRVELVLLALLPGVTLVLGALGLFRFLVFQVRGGSLLAVATAIGLHLVTPGWLWEPLRVLELWALPQRTKPTASLYARPRRRARWVRQLEETVCPPGFVGRLVAGRWTPDLPGPSRSDPLNLLLAHRAHGVKVLGRSTVPGKDREGEACVYTGYTVESPDGSLDFVLPELVFALSSYSCFRQRESTLVLALRSRALEWCKQRGLSDPFTNLVVPAAVSWSWTVSPREVRLASTIQEDDGRPVSWWA
jgi:hypothetical protein